MCTRSLTAPLLLLSTLILIGALFTVEARIFGSGFGNAPEDEERLDDGQEDAVFGAAIPVDAAYRFGDGGVQQQQQDISASSSLNDEDDEKDFSDERGVQRLSQPIAECPKCGAAHTADEPCNQVKCGKCGKQHGVGERCAKRGGYDDGENDGDGRVNDKSQLGRRYEGQ